MAGHGRAWQGRAGHDVALQGMQGVAHMAGSYHSYESSFILCTTKEGINTYQMVKTPFRLMYLVMGFGPFLGPNLPKNEHFVIFLENGAYDFF